MNEIAQVLETVLRDREAAKIMKLINYQYTIRPYSEDNENDKDNIRNADSQNIVRLPEDMYTLGYIHGKRAERARKKGADKYVPVQQV